MSYVQHGEEGLFLPSKSLRAIRFFYLASVDSVRLEGSDIVGLWAEGPRRVYAPETRAITLAEDFVNCPDDGENILRFTKLYGPLRATWKPGRKFRFSLAEWREWQEFYRQQWRRQGVTPFDTTLEVEKGDEFLTAGAPQPVPGERMELLHGLLYYKTATLWRYLRLEMLSCPRERLRTCGRANCQNLYFIAAHLNQRYCSSGCADWARRQTKLAWWKSTGKVRRESGQKKRSSGKKRAVKR